MCLTVLLVPPPECAQRAPVRVLIVAFVTGLLAVLLPLVAAPSAQAGSTVLCSGYSQCAAKRMFNGGYQAGQYSMYWRMYVGTNCTNYVAYRLVKNGMPNTRPWSSTGNAYNWGPANARITNATPTAGSVAWFKPGVGGAGSVGHVAYVEEVVSPTEIVVSESNFSGQFDWRRIVKDSRSWPSGFIHFNDKAMKNTAAPVITGTAAVDRPLQASAGSWSPRPTKVSYAWLADGVAIPGATSSTYTPTDAQRGKRLSVRVSASAADFPSGAAYSAATDRVSRGRFTLAERPQITGPVEVGEVLNVSTGPWSPEPETASYSWLADGVPVPGATGPTLKLSRSLLGKRIVVTTEVRRAGYIKARVDSAAVGPVVAGVIETPDPYVATGRPRVGNEVSLRGSYTPKNSTAAFSWLRDGTPIKGATDPSYVLTPADAGHEIVGQVALARQNYLPRTEQVRVGSVSVTPKMSIAASGRSRKALVVVRVKAPGVGKAGGEVLIKVGKRRVSVPVERGRSKVWLGGVEPGRQRVVARYLGDDRVARGRVTSEVWIKR